MIFAPTNRRIIRPGDKPSFEHTQRYGLIKGHWANVNRVGLWLFNEGSGGQVFDLSGNGNIGTFQGTAPSWSAGKFGSAVLLPGTDEYIDTDNGATAGDVLDLISNFTIVVGFTTYTPASTFYDTLVGKRLDAANYQFQFRVKTSHLDFLATSGSVNASTTLLAGKSYQGVVRHDGANIEIYLDGKLDCTPTALTLTHKNTDVYIGCNEYGVGASSHFWDGLIEYVYIYNRALSAGKVAQLYREPFLGIEKRTAPVYFFVPTGGVVYQELNLAVTADASVLESDTQQMIDTGKEVSADAIASESDTQQMIETGKEVSAAASVFCTDLKVVFELNLEVTASGSVVATDAHTMIETGKSVTAIATPAVIDTQAMVETGLGISAEGSVSCTDTMGLLAHIAAFMILRQCT